MGYLLDAIKDGIVEMARAIWGFIEKIVVRVLNFFNNIVPFFEDRNRLEKLKANRNLIATSIKDKLSNGDYNVVNCLFNKETNEIVDWDENAQGITAETLDSETKKAFAGKDMIVLQ